MTSLSNLFADIPADVPAELVTQLLDAKDLRIERIVSCGHCSPPGFWYDQEWDEWVLVIAGAARLQFEGEMPFDMPAGSFVSIPAHRRHRVDWTDASQSTIWLAIHHI